MHTDKTYLTELSSIKRNKLKNKTSHTGVDRNKKSHKKLRGKHLCYHHVIIIPDSKVHGAHMGPTWGRQGPDGPPCWPHEPCYQGSSSNRKHQPFPLLSYCAVAVCLKCFLHHILPLNTIHIPGFCFHYYCTVYDECKSSDTFWLADRIRLFVHYTISLSSLCKLIWRHWTYKMPVGYILPIVWVRLSIFSQLPI